MNLNTFCVTSAAGTVELYQHVSIMAMNCNIYSLVMAFSTLFQWVSQQYVLEIIAHVCDGQKREMQNLFREHSANELVMINSHSVIIISG